MRSKSNSRAVTTVSVNLKTVNYCAFRVTHATCESKCQFLDGPSVAINGYLKTHAAPLPPPSGGPGDGAQPAPRAGQRPTPIHWDTKLNAKVTSALRQQSRRQGQGAYEKQFPPSNSGHPPQQATRCPNFTPPPPPWSASDADPLTSFSHYKNSYIWQSCDSLKITRPASKTNAHHLDLNLHNCHSTVISSSSVRFISPVFYYFFRIKRG